MRVLFVASILLIFISLGSYATFKQVNLTNVFVTPPIQELNNFGHNYQFTTGLLTSKPNNQSFTIKIDGEEKIIKYDESTQFIINHKADVIKEKFDLDLRNANDFFSNVKLYDELSVSCPMIGECIATSVSIVKE